MVNTNTNTNDNKDNNKINISINLANPQIEKKKKRIYKKRKAKLTNEEKSAILGSTNVETRLPINYNPASIGGGNFYNPQPGVVNRLPIALPNQLNLDRNGGISYSQIENQIPQQPQISQQPQQPQIQLPDSTRPNRALPIPPRRIQIDDNKDNEILFDPINRNYVRMDDINDRIQVIDDVSAPIPDSLPPPIPDRNQNSLPDSTRPNRQIPPIPIPQEDIFEDALEDNELKQIAQSKSDIVQVPNRRPFPQLTKRRLPAYISRVGDNIQVDDTEYYVSKKDGLKINSKLYSRSGRGRNANQLNFVGMTYGEYLDTLRIPQQIPLTEPIEEQSQALNQRLLNDRDIDNQIRELLGSTPLNTSRSYIDTQLERLTGISQDIPQEVPQDIPQEVPQVKPAKLRPRPPSKPLIKQPPRSEFMSGRITQQPFGRLSNNPTPEATPIPIEEDDKGDVKLVPKLSFIEDDKTFLTQMASPLSSQISSRASSLRNQLSDRLLDITTFNALDIKEENTDSEGVSLFSPSRPVSAISIPISIPIPKDIPKDIDDLEEIDINREVSKNASRMRDIMLQSSRLFDEPTIKLVDLKSVEDVFDAKKEFIDKYYDPLRVRPTSSKLKLEDKLYTEKLDEILPLLNEFDREYKFNYQKLLKEQNIKEDDILTMLRVMTRDFGISHQAGDLYIKEFLDILPSEKREEFLNLYESDISASVKFYVDRINDSLNSKRLKILLSKASLNDDNKREIFNREIIRDRIIPTNFKFRINTDFNEELFQQFMKINKLDLENSKVFKQITKPTSAPLGVRKQFKYLLPTSPPPVRTPNSERFVETPELEEELLPIAPTKPKPPTTPAPRRRIVVKKGI